MSPAVVAAVCVGIVAGLFIYFISSKEQHQESGFRSDKKKDSYAEFHDYRSGLGEDSCSICLNPLKQEPTSSLVCKHRLHTSCFQLCKKNGLRRCPQCRENMY